jgi:hypothetical protein
MVSVPRRTGRGQVAIAVLYAKTRENGQEVEYAFGFPNRDRTLVIRKDTQRGTPADGWEDGTFRHALGHIVWRRNKEQAWPASGAVNA